MPDLEITRSMTWAIQFRLCQVRCGGAPEREVFLYSTKYYFECLKSRFLVVIQFEMLTASVSSLRVLCVEKGTKHKEH